MPDTGVFKFIQDLLTQILGYSPPEWLLTSIAVLILFGVIIWGLELVFVASTKLWLEVIRPGFYNPDEKRRRFRRRMFADHIESEIRYMNSLESWNDNRFTELEAQVEAEGSRKLFGVFSLDFSSTTGIRTEKSLSDAIEKSIERLVLLEGDPGSGKSVALRHITQFMAAKARKSRNLKIRIPIYINLKYLHREDSEHVDRILIEKFVFKTLNRVNDRDIDQYLHEEFNRGIEEGTWFFLFDSFDEIPEVLSSTGADDAIRIYAEAIRDFLHGMNNCKGIVASREYKGPRFLGWPKFRILPLSPSRRTELVKRTGLSLKIQESIIDGLAVSIDDFQNLASNPMFLNLICDYMNKPVAPEFPTHIHMVFQEYIQKRLSRDADRVKQRFNKTPKDIQSAAEKLAFCMTADQGIGLSPTVMQLKQSTEKLELELEEGFDVFTEALAYLKLARLDTSFIDGSKTFSFAHRRFQEYFATAVVLQNPNRVSAQDLLMNGRWRETSVVMFQTQGDQQTLALTDTVYQILVKLSNEFGKEFENFDNSVKVNQKIHLPRFKLFSLAKWLFEPFTRSIEKIQGYIQVAVKAYESRYRQGGLNKPNDWPTGLYHLVSIIQDGFSGKTAQIPAQLQEIIDKILVYISKHGDLLDEKWCLELAGAASQEHLVKFITKGIWRNSRSTNQIAYRQVAKLFSIPEYVSRFIDQTIFSMAISNNLFRSRREIYAQLSRMQDRGEHLFRAKLLAWAPIIDLLLAIPPILVLYSLGIRTFVNTTTLILLVWGIAWLAGYFGLSLLVKFLGGFICGIVLFFGLGILESQSRGVTIKFLNDMDGGYLFAVSKYSLFFWLSLTCLSWSIVLLWVGSIGNWPSRIAWPFLGFYVSLSFYCLLIILRWLSRIMPTDLLDPIVILWQHIGLYVVVLSMLFCIDWLYLLSRAVIIWKYMPTDYRDFPFVQWISRVNNEVFSPLLIFASFLFMYLIGAPQDNDGEIAFQFIVFIVGVASIFFLYKSAIPFIKAAYAYRAWRRKLTTIELLEFLDVLRDTQHNFFRLIMIRRVIKKQLIQASELNIQYLRHVIAFITVKEDFPKRTQKTIMEDIDPQLLIHLDPNQDWYVPLLDEFNTLFEQLKLSSSH